MRDLVLDEAHEVGKLGIDLGRDVGDHGYEKIERLEVGLHVHAPAHVVKVGDLKARLAAHLEDRLVRVVGIQIEARGVRNGGNRAASPVLIHVRDGVGADVTHLLERESKRMHRALQTLQEVHAMSLQIPVSSPATVRPSRLSSLAYFATRLGGR